MNHYLVITDINTRQYVFPIKDNGLSLSSLNQSFIIHEHSLEMLPILKIVNSENAFIINNSNLFNFKNIANIEIKSISESEF